MTNPKAPEDKKEMVPTSPRFTTSKAPRMAPGADAETRTVELIYRAADALWDAEKAIQAIPAGCRAEIDALLDTPVYPGDLRFSLGKRLTEIADAWQEDLDGRASIS